MGAAFLGPSRPGPPVLSRLASRESPLALCPPPCREPFAPFVRVTIARMVAATRAEASNMDRLSDEHLLAAVLAGEMDALAALVERHQGPLTGYLDRLVGPDWALAQDLVQETFLRVLRQHTARGRRPFKPWLYAIATNLA